MGSAGFAEVPAKFLRPRADLPEEFATLGYSAERKRDPKPAAAWGKGPRKGGGSTGGEDPSDGRAGAGSRPSRRTIPSRRIPWRRRPPCGPVPARKLPWSA